MPKFQQNSDVQRDSTNLRQLELLGGTNFESVELDVTTIRRQPSLAAAVGLCISASGKERKQVYGALDIDSATFSRIESGQANFPLNKLVPLMKLCLNEAPRIWLDEAMGYNSESMRRHQDDGEKRIALLEQENRDLKRLLRLKADVENSR